SDAREIKTNKTVQKSDDYKTNVNTAEEIKLTVLNGTRKEIQSETSSEESTNQGMLKSIKKAQNLDFEPSLVKEYVDKEMYKGSEYTYNSDTSNKEILYFNQMHDSISSFNNNIKIQKKRKSKRKNKRRINKTREVKKYKESSKFRF